MTGKLVVFDLDGTLISTNSYKKWLIFVTKRLIFINSNPIAFIKPILLRLLGIYDREKMKRDILMFSEKLNKKLHKDFALLLIMDVRRELYLELKRLKSEGYRVIVNTAAPEFYVSYLCDMLGVEYIATTAKLNEQGTENIGKVKIGELLKYLHAEDVTLDIFFTDDYHDIPMAEISEITYLVEPSQKTLARFSELTHVKYAVVKG